MTLISIAIPTYEMNGLGARYLQYSLDLLALQTFKDFDVVISDNSCDDLIERVYEKNKTRLDIKYFKNNESLPTSSANLNNAILKSTGKIIKILFQDDFLYNETSLEKIAFSFDLKKDNWHVSACQHTKNGVDFFRPFYPKYNHQIHLGNNTISSPSVLSIKNDSPMMFDERLIWLMDCDYYKRLYEKYGEPKIFNEICVVNRVGDHQVSNTIANNDVRASEKKYIKQKYALRKRPKIKLPNVTLVSVSSVKISETIKALEYSMKDIEFSKVLLVTHEKPNTLRPDITFVKCERITSIDAYSKFMLFDLAEHINTNHALIIQYDGFVVRPFNWDDEFLKYDYIGAPWPKGAHFTKDGTPVLVGNGGFSLRSKRLIEAFNALNLPFSDNGTGFFNEDGAICNYFRKELENAGLKFANTELAERFSLEDKNSNRLIKPFGFHKNKKFMPLISRIKYIFT